MFFQLIIVYILIFGVFNEHVGVLNELVNVFLKYLVYFMKNWVSFELVSVMY